jgi:hypothetical protein
MRPGAAVTVTRGCCHAESQECDAKATGPARVAGRATPRLLESGLPSYADVVAPVGASSTELPRMVA